MKKLVLAAMALLLLALPFASGAEQKTNPFNVPISVSRPRVLYHSNELTITEKGNTIYVTGNGNKNGTDPNPGKEPPADTCSSTQNAVVLRNTLQHYFADEEKTLAHLISLWDELVKSPDTCSTKKTTEIFEQIVALMRKQGNISLNAMLPNAGENSASVGSVLTWAAVRCPHQFGTPITELFKSFYAEEREEPGSITPSGYYLERLVQISLQEELHRRKTKAGVLTDVDIRTLGEMALEITEINGDDILKTWFGRELLAEIAPDIAEQIDQAAARYQKDHPKF